MRGGLLLYASILGFAVGVGVAPFIDARLAFAGLLLVFSVSAAALLPLLHERHRAMLCVFVCVAAALGIVRFEAAERLQPEAPFAERVGSFVALEGVVDAEPDRRESTQRLFVTTEGVRILVITEPYPAVRYGDVVRIEGVLAVPENFTGDTGRIFDYEGYLKKDGVRYLVRRAVIEVVGGGEGNPLFAVLYEVKWAFLSRLDSAIREPESALMSGLLLGGKQSLGEDLVRAFTVAGVIHIVVLSGFNMTIVAYALMRVFGRIFSARRALAVGALGIALFCIMVGLSATVLRAGAMALLALLAAALGRRYAILRALFLAGGAMLLHNPYLLAYDPSFQLSFTATLGLLLFAPSLQTRLGWVPERWGLREIAAATIATQFSVLPLLLWMTGELSLVALPANMLVLPFIPVTMLIGFIAGTVGFLSALLAVPFALVAQLLLSYEIFIATFFAGLPGATIVLPPFSFFVTAGVYGGIALLWWRRADLKFLYGAVERVKNG